MKTSPAGWLVIILVIVGCVWLAGSIVFAGTPDYADPMNGDHIKALQPKRCPFGLCDQQNQNSANTNLTNMKAEHEAGQAAVGFAVATAVINTNQPPQTVMPMGVSLLFYCIGGLALVGMVIVITNWLIHH